jgi:hypothetical protein
MLSMLTASVRTKPGIHQGTLATVPSLRIVKVSADHLAWYVHDRTRRMQLTQAVWPDRARIVRACDTFGRKAHS